jgi:hypothetical protein
MAVVVFAESNETHGSDISLDVSKLGHVVFLAAPFFAGRKSFFFFS